MTKIEAIKLFKSDNAEYIKENKDDKVAIRTSWIDYTDSLMKMGEITESQCDNWTNPFP